MMQKSTTFTTIFRLKKCYFNYDMQKDNFFSDLETDREKFKFVAKRIFFSKTENCL
jgi:hypothetical protein